MANKLKIALCLSGQPRGLPVSVSLLKQNIIEPNQPDVFYHTWHNEADVGKSYNSTQQTQTGMVGSVRAKTSEILQMALKPKVHITEPQRSFEHLSGLISHPTTNQEILGSQLFSAYQANNLRREYEEKNGFKYDIVLKTRFDLYYYHPIVLADYLADVLAGRVVVMKKFQQDQENFNSPDRPMTDIFAFGNSEVMNVFSSVYPAMSRLNPLLQNPFSENYHGRFVRLENNIEVAQGDFNLNLMHRIIKVV